MVSTVPNNKPVGLTRETLEALKAVSGSAFACAVYGASINNDTRSMETVIDYLSGFTNGKSNALMANGKSVLDREYPVSAFLIKTDANGKAKISEPKTKGYVLAMLSSQVIGSEKSAEQIFDLMETQKKTAQSVIALFNKIADTADDGTYHRMGVRLIQSMPNAADVLAVMQHMNVHFKKSTDVKLAIAKEAILGLMGQDLFCTSLVKHLEKTEEELGKRLINTSVPNVLFSAMTPAAWPKNEKLGNMLLDIQASRAAHVVMAQNAQLDRGQSPLDFDDCFINPKNPKGKTVSAKDFLKSYGEIQEPVHLRMDHLIQANLVHAMHGLSQEGATRIWEAVAPIQKRIDREGGRPIWQTAFNTPSYRVADPDKAVSEHLLVQLAKEHAKFNEQAASEALGNCVAFFIQTNSTKIVRPKAAEELLKAGANPNMGLRSFIGRLKAGLNPEDGKVELKKHPRLEALVRAQEAKLEIQASSTRDPMADLEAPKKRSASAKM